MDKEYRLLDALSRDAGLSQRQVAKETGLSLGMVNLILSRLVKTGAIKMVSLNGRSVRYMLTPTGIAEKTQRAYDYLFRTIGTFRDLRDRTDALIADFYTQGVREFIIDGDGEMADIAEFCLSHFRQPGATYRRGGELPPSTDTTKIVLRCSPDEHGSGYVGVSVLERLVNSGTVPIGGSDREGK